MASYQTAAGNSLWRAGFYLLDRIGHIELYYRGNQFAIVRHDSIEPLSPTLAMFFANRFRERFGETSLERAIRHGAAC